MRALLKVLLFFAVSAIAARITGFIVSRQRDEGQRGQRRVPPRGHPQRTRVHQPRGRPALDGRAASPWAAPSWTCAGPRSTRPGREVLARNTLGGLPVIVREDWAVTRRRPALGGGNTEVDVTPLDDLPEDAPRLHIDVTTRFAGTVISTKDRGF